MAGNNKANNFRFNIGTVFKDSKRNIKIIDKEYRLDSQKQRRKYYKFKCRTCGWDEGWLLESNIISNHGCACCAGKVVVEGINDIPTTAPWMVKYFQDGHDEAKLYTRSSTKKVVFICPDCNKVKDKPTQINNLHRTKSIGCTCGDGKSSNEKYMNNLLSQLGINYEWGYAPDWLKGYDGNKRCQFKMDFYLSDYSLIVEMDGGLGHGIRVHPSKDMTLEETLERDQWKDEQALKRGISVIRINCCSSNIEELKSNIIDALSNIFDLNNVNWDKCLEAATRNIVKDVCVFYENNKHLLNLEISKHFNIGGKTLSNYLKRGHQLNWCTYDKEVIKNRQIKTLTKTNSKKRIKVIVLFNDKKIATYNSIRDCVQKSYTDFGTQFYVKTISHILNGKQKKTKKGYSFKAA